MTNTYFLSECVDFLPSLDAIDILCPTASCSRLSADAKHDEAVTSAKSSTYKKISTPSGTEDGRPLTARKGCSLIRYPELLLHVECIHPKR